MTYRNTLEHIYFHDCVVKHAEWENNALILNFEYFYLLKTHPNNTARDYMQIDNAIMRFENAKVNLSQWHDYTKAAANAFEKKKKSGDTSVYLNIDPDEIEIHDIDILDALHKIEIIDLKTTKSGEIYNIKIRGSGHRDIKYRNSDRKIEFEYSDESVIAQNQSCNGTNSSEHGLE